MSHALNKGNRNDANAETFIAETLREHPRPGSNSNGGIIVAAPLTKEDPITGSQSPSMSKGNKQGCATIGVSDGVGVRRLTPIECSRLQGLPDDWTLLDAKTPDSRRYSALGDAVTANVAEWIGCRLAAADNITT